MIRDLDDGGLLCIHQTSHALMAAEFCRHWGNETFAPPTPYAPVLLAVDQHDNGWFEWERSPRLDGDGRPMDFITFTEQTQKTRLWQRGIDRLYGQHPYAALLVSRHASLLYQGFQRQGAYDGDNAQAVQRFLAEQQALQGRVKQVLGTHARYIGALAPEQLAANVQLLQFGDRAALQVAIPWANRSTSGPVPVDGCGGQTSLEMAFDESTISFDPWPFGVDRFEVHMEGFRLVQTTFSDQESYHQALAEAPLCCRTWTVTPARGRRKTPHVS